MDCAPVALVGPYSDPTGIVLENEEGKPLSCLLQSNGFVGRLRHHGGYTWLGADGVND